MYKKHVKLFFDTIIASLILLILVPILLTCSFLLLLANNGSPFFFQKRPGLKGIIFTIVKFKTMNDAKDESGELLPDSLRLTQVGRFIRKTSLDELPQLINVLKGDMSLVGPRPLLVEYLPLYNEHQKRRHEVKPGITGWAQVNGRNAISWQEKFDLDVWYVNHCSFSLDMKILWLTILKVLKREGINQAGQATVEKFNGYN
jgi:lipopolysaccharide/colanic/teichoic acid biosynthesis glycosyltransferase